LHEDFVKTTLREELIQLHNQQQLGFPLRSSGSPIASLEDLPTTILFPAVIQRVRIVWQDLEKAVQGLNLQTHSSELSFVSIQGKFQSTTVKGQLKLEPKQWLDQIEQEPYTVRIRFAVVYECESTSKHLEDIEIAVKIVQLDNGGAVEMRSVIQVLQAQCSEGLAR
jgi:hypothetical protein